MNYLAHSLPFVFREHDLDRWRVAGTSLPDWLRVIDKKARLRPNVLAGAPADDERFVALREGAQRHHDDDLRFHTDDEFEALTHELTAVLRAGFPHLRASTLGHVMIELLLDAALMHKEPRLLDRYYAALDALDDDLIGMFVRRATGRPMENARSFLDRFKRARFLAAYATDAGLLSCLRGVWSRAGLGGIDEGVVDVIRRSRPRVTSLAGRFLERA